MIVTETLDINGRSLIRTFSDSGYTIERDGVRYSEALDPAEFGRTYMETDEKILYDGDPNEATDADYQAALVKLGVDV